MTALVAKLANAPSVNVRGIFATLFAVELREALARDGRQGVEGSYLWGL